MTLTAEQQKKVEQNIRLVQKVINDKVHGSYQLGIYTYDDIFQIGCIGLCKAVATDRGGTFSTYAYRLIWNEICDALVYATRRQTREIPSDLAPLVQDESEMDTEVLTQRIDVQNALERAKENASPCVVKGIAAMQKMAAGATSREIGDSLGVSAKLVCAWVSKARAYLRSRPDIRALAGQ